MTAAPVPRRLCNSPHWLNKGHHQCPPSLHRVMHLGCTWQTHDLVVLCASLHHVHIIRFHTILGWGFTCESPQQLPIYCKWSISLNWSMFVLNAESMEFFWQPGICCNSSWSLNWAIFLLNRERMWTHHRVPLNCNLLTLSLSQVVFPFCSIQTLTNIQICENYKRLQVLC